MSSKAVKVPSPYGPIDVALVACDGPQCSLMCQSQHMVGWLKLGPQGLDVPTMGGPPPDPMDFCSLPCLKSAVDLMTGSQ